MVDNRITQWMTRLPSGEILDGEPNPNPLGFGFVEFGVGEGGSAMWYDVTGQSLIVRSVVPLVRVPPPTTSFLVLLLQGFLLVRPP
jgi:hypothetical protein